MITKVYLNAAKDAVNESYRAIDKGDYLKSWGMTVPARFNYLADAVLNAGAAPCYLIGAGYGAGEAVFTWGRETKVLSDSVKGLDNSLARVLFGTFGAAVSPCAATSLEVDSFGEVVAVAAVAAGVGALAFAAAKSVSLPNFISYNAQAGWTFGWHWFR